MIDIHSEQLVPLSKAGAHLPGKVHRSTLERWRLHGRRGVKLETVLVGGQRYTSKEALKRFVNGVTAAADGQPVHAEKESTADRERAIERAERFLEANGA